MDSRKKVEAEVERVLRDMQAHMLGWIDQDRGARWSNILNAADEAKRKIMDAIRESWPSPDA